jgi:polyhydroxyalkanoate synthase
MDNPNAGFQNGSSEWITQLTDSLPWQTWLKQTPFNTQAAGSLSDLATGVDPNVMQQLHDEYMRQFTKLWQDMLVSKTTPISDKRFSSSAWQDNPLCSFSAAAYLLNSQFLMAMADAVNTSTKAKQKLRFTLQQMIDAMSPANFLATNPTAQQKFIETNGESLMQGISHMLTDLRKGYISQTDESAFEVGKNVATTEGAVIFENELFQLLQYKPLTKTVYEIPLLIVPPCINKYYILDLQPENSLVRYAVEQGHTVYLISWRNTDQSLAEATWDDYIEDAIIEALHLLQEISKQDKVNALGFCVGGTLLCTALTVLAGRGEMPAASVTLLTTLLDFTDTGALDVFIDEAQVGMREQTIGKGGLMPGRDFTSAFASLRSNDLVWNYVDKNYLKGEKPPAFDLLYWNADSTNLPGPMFCWYLRNTYLENNLKIPGKLSVAGTKLDLRKISAPTFVYASREDHIVPWTSAYISAKLLNPKKAALNRFVLGASGHIAGVINPPAKKKRSYWKYDKMPADPALWLEKAKEYPGSWWTEWSSFLSEHSGKRVTAPRQYGSKTYQPIEPAPGRYVKEKAR